MDDLRSQAIDILQRYRGGLPEYKVVGIRLEEKGRVNRKFAEYEDAEKAKDAQRLMNGRTQLDKQDIDTAIEVLRRREGLLP